MRICGRQFRSSEIFMFAFIYMVANYAVVKIQQKYSVPVQMPSGQLPMDSKDPLELLKAQGDLDSAEIAPQSGIEVPSVKPAAAPPLVVKAGLAGIDDLDIATDAPPHADSNWHFKEDDQQAAAAQETGVDTLDAPAMGSDEYGAEEDEGPGAPKLKTIVFWNTFFTSPDFRFGFGHQAFKDAKCPVHTCRTTNDRSQVANADAVVFHGPRIEGFPPPIRKPGQIYVYLQQEPHYTMSTEEQAAFHGYFNMTMTHRQDSDIYIPYGRVVYDEASIKPKPIHINPKSRPKTIVWAVSHCSTPSRREWYVKELQKYVDIDVYGACGDMECSKDDYLYCFSKFEKEYRFYIAMENNHCKDYISEKVYRALLYKMVPIVFGGGNYSTGTPPHSVIDIADFQNPKDLATYLIYLSGNDKAYNKYYAWKTSGYILEHQRKIIMGDGFCKLCEILHDPNYKYKDYTDLKHWWTTGTCDAFTIPRWRKKNKW